MKKLFYLLLIVPMVLVGCKKGAKDAEPESIKLSVTPNSIISPSIGADYSLTLTAPESWTASCADSWVKINPISGNAGTVEISVKIAADKTSTEANSKIVFKSGDQTVEVPVKRLAKDPARLMVVSETEIKTPKDGGVYTVKVESNIKWQIASDVSWAKIDGEAVKRNNAVITVNVEENTIPEESVGTITVTPLEGSGVEKQTVTITRSSSEATSMRIDKSQIDFYSSGGDVLVNVNTTARWIAYKSWDADWLTLSDNQKTGNGEFTIHADPATSSDDMSTIVTVEEIRSDDYMPVQLTILVTRKGKAGAELSVAPTSISAPAEGGDFTVTIKSNYAWTASIIGAKIFSTSITQGNGDATMVVSVKPATDEKEATGSVTIYSSYGGAKQTINIHRQPKFISKLEVSPTKIDAPYAGQEYIVNVASNTGWQVSTSNSKVASVSTESGEGNGSFKVTVMPATVFVKSTAEVNVTTVDGSKMQKIEITLESLPTGKYTQKPFSVSSKKKVFISPGNLQFQASTNTWRFANYQYDYVGGKYSGNVYENGTRCNNGDISGTYDGWIDLFGWGTGNNPTLHICGDEYIDNPEKFYYEFIDWGINGIKYQQTQYRANSWRTLTGDEWDYLVSERENANSLCGYAQVEDRNGEKIKGCIFLPDDWVSSSAVSFTPGVTRYDVNDYTLSQWEKMEAKGAIFLPCAGWRNGNEMRNSSFDGIYWSSDKSESLWAYELILQSYYTPKVSKAFVVTRDSGCSVRLVQDAN